MSNDSKTFAGAISGAVVLFFFLLFLFAKFGPAIPFSVNQITTNKTDLFSVSADGKAFAKPDIAQINLGFTTNKTTISAVQTEANQKINAIVAAVKKLGVEDKDIKTTSYNLRPDYDYSGRTQKIVGYVIDVNIFVKVRDFTKINDVIDAGTANGANQVGNLNFTLDDPTLDKLQNDARKLAISNAKQKASAIASETGISLGKIINVYENQNSPVPRAFNMLSSEKAIDSAGGAAPSVSTQIEPGQSEITVTVTLSYETR